MLQFPFDFQSNTNFLREDFILSEANRSIFSYINQWPDWGTQRFSRLLYLHGPKGAGKTHLAHIWQQRTQASFVTDIPLYNDASGCYILENAGSIPLHEETLLHFINAIVENNGFLLITSQLAPAQLPLHLPDLTSRLKALPALGLSAPDDALLHAVLAKHFFDRQLRIEPEVVSYLLTRIERSFAAATVVADLLDKKALSEKRNITIPFVRELLTSL